VSLLREGVLNYCVGGEEALGRAGCLEALHLPLPSSDRQVAVLGPVVLDEHAASTASL